MKYLGLFVTALCALGAFPAEPGHGTLIAHRGESVDAPENTLPAFKTAVERGFGFECDVIRCCARRVVCIDRMEFDANGDIKPIVMTK